MAKGGTAYLVPADEYRGLVETVYLLSAPRNAQRLRESITEVRSGAVTGHELDRS